MNNDFIIDRINQAHHMIDEGNYQNAVEILKNLKFRVHDGKLEADIKHFEKTCDETLEKDIVNIDNTSVDPLRKQSNINEKYYGWATSYLNFYDRLVKQNEVF